METRLGIAYMITEVVNMPVIATIHKQGESLVLVARKRYSIDDAIGEVAVKVGDRVKLFPSDPYSASLEIRNTKKAGLHAVCTSSVSADIYFCHIKLTKDGEYNLVEEWQGERKYRMYRVVKPEEETCPVRRAMRKAKVSLRNLRIVEVRDWGEVLEIRDILKDTVHGKYEEWTTDAPHPRCVGTFQVEDAQEGVLHEHASIEGATYVIVILKEYTDERGYRNSITRVYAKPNCDWEALVHEFELTTPRYTRYR